MYVFNFGRCGMRDDMQQLNVFDLEEGQRLTMMQMTYF